MPTNRLCTEQKPPRTLVMGLAQACAEARSRLAHDEAGAIPVGVLPARHADAEPMRTAGLTPLGTPDDLEAIITNNAVEVVLLAIPSAMHALTRELTTRIEKCGARAHWTPPMSDTLHGRTGHAHAALDLAALIGREPRPIDTSLVRDIVEQRTIMITGAGGSIGSEIARIVSAYEPERIILMDRSENALFEIDREIASIAPAIQRRAVLHDVVDAPRTESIMRQLRPNVVFHAAAHKHVPMMEDHPGAAVTNNVFGTKAVLDSATDAGAERFVLVSTDKAVHPTSVMGATKRLAELYVRAQAPHTHTRCSIVRFGNVLGSACSVLPIWDRQLAEGGPITVTDARMTRYFMTIPEAASLVIQSAALPQGDEASVYVLDMGEPIRIADLAQRLLQQRGVRANASDVEIRVTGVRPGEKLYEQLAYDTESLLPTDIEGVRAWSGDAPEMRAVTRMIEALANVRSSAEPSDVIRVLRECVPEMKPSDASITTTPAASMGEIANITRTTTPHAA